MVSHMFINVFIQNQPLERTLGGKRLLSLLWQFFFRERHSESYVITAMFKVPSQ